MSAPQTTTGPRWSVTVVVMTAILMLVAALAIVGTIVLGRAFLLSAPTTVMPDDGPAITVDPPLAPPFISGRIDGQAAGFTD